MAKWPPEAPVDLRRRRFCRLVGCACLAASGCGEPRRAPPQAGEQLPELVLSRLDGSVADLREHAGRALVLNLWATWCGPCRAEMPSLQQLADRFSHDDLAVVAISVDDDLNLVREFLLRYAIRFPVYADTRQPTARERLGVTAYPTTLLVKRDGRIAEVVTGEKDWAAVPVVERIEALLGVRARPATAG